jgi:Arc/MetJ-type ribon-helix-helix transcriptional regulator
MEVELTPDQKAFARRAVESGRLHSEEEAVQEALALWEGRERRRLEFLATLDRSRASLARGEGRAITEESMRELAAEVRERGRALPIAQLANAYRWPTVYLKLERRSGHAIKHPPDLETLINKRLSSAARP